MRLILILLALALTAQASELNDPSLMQFHNEADAELQRLRAILARRAACTDAGLPPDCDPMGESPTRPED